MSAEAVNVLATLKRVLKRVRFRLNQSILDIDILDGVVEALENNVPAKVALGLSNPGRRRLTPNDRRRKIKAVAAVLRRTRQEPKMTQAAVLLSAWISAHDMARYKRRAEVLIRDEDDDAIPEPDFGERPTAVEDFGNSESAQGTIPSADAVNDIK